MRVAVVHGDLLRRAIDPGAEVLRESRVVHEDAVHQRGGARQVEQRPGHRLDLGRHGDDAALQVGLQRSIHQLESDPLAQDLVAQVQLFVSLGGARKVDGPILQRILDDVGQEDIRGQHDLAARYRRLDVARLEQLRVLHEERLRPGDLLDLLVGQRHDGFRGPPQRCIEMRTPGRLVRALADDERWVARGIFVGCARRRQLPQLLHVPRRVQVTHHDDGDVLAHTLHLLRIPQREGVVVTVGEEHGVRLDALQQIVRPVAGRPVVAPVGPREVEQERQQREDQNGGSGQRRTRRRRQALRVVHALADPLPQRGQPDAGPNAPQREADDEEVVALTHLAHLHGHAFQRDAVAVAEVEVEGEAEGQRREQEEEIPEALLVALEVLNGAEDAEEDEQQRDQRARPSEPRAVARDRARPLPVEVLEVVADLCGEQLGTARQVLSLHRGNRIREHGRLVVLLARERLAQVLATAAAERQDALQRRADTRAGGVRFIDDRLQAGADGQVHVRRQADHDRDDGEGVKLPVLQHARVVEQDENQQRRCRQERHQVVAHREGEDEDHQDEQVVILALAEIVAPVEGQPGKQRDREQ